MTVKIRYRQGYTPMGADLGGQAAWHTATVGELLDALKQHPRDMPVLFEWEGQRINVVHNKCLLRERLVDQFIDPGDHQAVLLVCAEEIWKYEQGEQDD